MMNKLYLKVLLVWVWMSLLVAPLPAQVINEFVFSHAGSDINEYIEILGEPNTDYSSLSLLLIDGNNVGSLAGRIDQVFTLGTTDQSGYWTTGVSDFGFINESQTILLVSNFTATQGFDIDLDDNGSIDTLVWASVLDGVAVQDGDRGDRTYTSVVLRQGFGESVFTVEGASRIPNGQDTNSQEDWRRNDRNGAGLPDASFATLNASAGEAPNTPGIDNRFQEVTNFPNVFFRVSQQSVFENGGQVQIEIGLSHPNASATEVELIIDTALSTANAGDDFNNLNNSITVTFPANTIDIQTITFDLVNDTVREVDETLTLVLQNPSNGATLPIPSQKISIIDDDNPPSSFLVINEILYDPDDTDTGNEYLEFRGDVFSRVPPNTYFVAIEGDNGGSIGEVQTIFNLSNLNIGDNGFLVLTQGSNNYRTDTSAQVLTSNARGWTGLPFFQVGGSNPDIENLSVTFFLIETTSPPQIGDDIDTDDNGTPDGSIFLNWNVLDGISILNSNTDFGYASVIFAPASSTNVPAGSQVVVADPLLQSYVGRRGNSVAIDSSSWVAANISASAPDWLLTPQGTYPLNFGGLALNHIGSENFTAPTGPILSFTQTSLTINEEATTLQFRVNIEAENANSTTVSVVVDETESTVTPDEDFQSFSTPPLLFFPGNDGSSKTFSINILDDAIEEGSETLVLRLSSPSNNAVIANGRLEIRIRPSELSIMPIANVRNAQDEQGFPTMEVARIQGVIHGPNFATADTNATNFNFTIVDGPNARDGIGLFITQSEAAELLIDSLIAQGGNLKEGDELIIEGDVATFNGRMQIVNPSFLERVAQNQALQSPALVSTLDEDSESRLVQLDGVIIIDPSEWRGNPDSTSEGFSVRIARRGDTLTMRVDGDTELANLTFADAFGDPNTGYVITGFGGQFDTNPSDGLLDAYQILPYQVADIVTGLPENLSQGSLKLFPNPSLEGIYQIQLEGELSNQLNIAVYDAQGRLKGTQVALGEDGKFALNVEHLSSGMYWLVIQVGSEKIVRRVMKD